MNLRADDLARLGYCELWLQSGVLTHEDLSAQIATISLNGADQSTEHYRYGAFRRYLESRSLLADDVLGALLVLISVDRDPGMAGAMLHDLAKWPDLTAEQFERIVGHSDDNAFQKIVVRERLKRAFRLTPGSVPLQRELAQSGDSLLQAWLLDWPCLDRAVLEMLADDSSSKHVRNIARTTLNRAEYRLQKR